MARKIRYHPEFDSDVRAAADWYDERQEELGTNFISNVRKAVSDLIADPMRRTLMEYGIRYWPIGRFPHVVFYDFTDTELVVLGVTSSTRSPKFRFHCFAYVCFIPSLRFGE